MTSNDNDSEESPASQAPFRPNLRQATLILPKTGQRVKRVITFRDSPSLTISNGRHSPDERSHLLETSSASPKDRSLFQRFQSVLRERLAQAWRFLNSRTGRGVLKCSIAYFLGSLATFVPSIAALLGQQDGKHMVATITVYFHPARSRGSMFEAIMLALLAFAYAAFIGFTSMGCSILFGRTLDLIALGHAVVLVFFCGGGLGFVGWIKQRLGDPLVNIACSLTSLAIITVLTKEGAVQAAAFSDDKIVQVLKMITMGVIATTAVSFFVSPISARTDLREDMIRVTDSFAEALTMITRGFLSGSEKEMSAVEYQSLSDQFKKALTSLEKNLREAKFEHYVTGTEREYRLESRLVDCMHRLARDISGLRAAASTQFQLLAQPSIGSSHHTSEANNDNSGSIPQESTSAEAESFNTDANKQLPDIATPADIFTDFIVHLGPSMKSLAFSLKEILDELPFGPGPDYQIVIDDHFKSSLEEAIDLYSKARETALSYIYKDKELRRHRSSEVEADYEEVAASCGVFSYSLQDFAKEIGGFLDTLAELKTESVHRPRGRTWNWLNPWTKRFASKDQRHHRDVEQRSLVDQNEGVQNHVNIPSPTQRKASLVGQLAQTSRWSYKYRLWRALAVFRRDDTKYAIKVGVGAALYAMPSFISSSRPLFQHFRGEWGLLSYMLVCSMTIGASNTTGYSRFLGTCTGAVCAILAWTASQGNVFGLAAFGWLMAVWTAYIIIAQGKGPMGRFIMLTYNLSALYAYSLSVKDLDDDDDEGGISPIISEIAFHRVVAVFSGCLWGLLVTRVIWPISARQKLKDGLSILWLRMGHIWKRPPLEYLLDGQVPSNHMDLQQDFGLHKFMGTLESHCSAACSEADLRGPFPNEAYARMMRDTSSMLDAFHAMNIMIMKEPNATSGELAILRYTADERAQLNARISHLFQVMASSMKLEYPLTDVLPNTNHARDKLLAKIFQFRREEKDGLGTKDEDFALLYAYALVTGHIAKHIETIGEELDKLFKVLDEEMIKLQ